MLAPEQCELIIAEARSGLRRRGGTLHRQGCGGWRVHARSTTAKLIGPLGHPLDAQVVGYGPGDGYTWHTDGAARAYSEVTLLSDPADFTGGKLEFRCRSGAVPLHMQRGTSVRFDSSLEHQVSEVLSGERWTLVVWTPA